MFFCNDRRFVWIFFRNRKRIEQAETQVLRLPALRSGRSGRQLYFWVRSLFLRAAAEPGLLDVGVGHAGDVVGYGAGEALRGDLRLVVFGELGGVGDERGEEALHDLCRAGAGFFERGAVVEIGVEEILGLGAGAFDFWAQHGNALWGAADFVEGDGLQPCGARADFRHQVGYQQIEDGLEGFIHCELGRGGGVLAEHCVVEAAKERDAVADLCKGEDSGLEAIVEIGGEVGDFVGEVDELGFEGRELAEEVFGELGMGFGGVVAGVLDDAFADAEGQVEAAEGGVALLKPGNDAQGVQVVVKCQVVCLQAAVEGLLAGVAEGRMADVVGQGEGLGQFDIEAERAGEGAGDLGDLKGVGEAAAEMVGGRVRRAAGEDLGLAGETTEGAGVQDASRVAGEGRAVKMGRLWMRAAGELAVRVAAHGNTWK